MPFSLEARCHWGSPLIGKSPKCFHCPLYYPIASCCLIPRGADFNMAVPKQALAVEVSLADDFHAFSVSHLSKNAILNYEKVTDCAKKLKTWLTDQDNRS